ncbi:MAG TPA: hypothetical protein VKU83_00085 [Puia sp.]|nr:hypothetical protein [Puia sp.]
MRKLFLSALLCCSGLLPGLSLRAQAPAPATGGVGLWDAHHFLWFTGHWNKSGSRFRFIVDRGNTATTGAGGGGAAPGTTGDNDDPPGNPPDGGTITIHTDGTVNLDNSGVTEWNKKMDEALKSEEDYLRALQDPGDNLDPTTHHLHQLLVPDARQRVNDIQTYKIGADQDMLGADSKSAPPQRTLSDAAEDLCRDIKPDYDLIMNYYKTQVKGHNNDLRFPAPPTADYDCYSCDSSVRKLYDTAIYHYADNFGKEEDDIVMKGLAILHKLGLMGVSTESGYSPELDNAFRKNKQDPSKAGACSFIELTYFSDAVYAIAHHLYLRAEKMVYANKNNYKAAEAIIRAYLKQARAWAMRSGNTEGNDMLPLLASLAGQAVDFYIKAFRHDDWRQVGNATLILQMIRDEQMLGGTDDNKGMDFVNELLKVMNGFELSIEMDIKIGKDGVYYLAHLKGKCHIIPSFQGDSNQCYKWVIADENNQDLQGFYKEKNLQTIDCNAIAIQAVTPPQAPITYTGTKKYTAALMGLSMDFCHPGHDTIVLGGFIANPPSAGTWLYPHGFVSAAGVTGMEEFFEDIHARKKLADDGEAQKAQTDLQAQAEKLKAQMEALKDQIGNSQSGANAGANYEKMMELKNKMISQLSTPVTAKLLYEDFPLPVKNNEPVLVDNRFDAKQINPQESQAIVYGYYTIHIENDGNGKPKPKTAGSPAGKKN